MADPHSILKKVFGYDSFRPGQEDIVRRLLDLSLIHISEPTRPY